MYRSSTLSLALAICFLMLLSALASQAQEIGKLYLSGKVVNEHKRGMEATIMIFKGKKKIDEFQTNWIGKFERAVALQDSFALVVYSENYVSKTIYVNTFLPDRKQKTDYNFPFFIDLYPIGRTPANIDLERPVGKIIFAGTQFIYDINFTDQQNEKLKEFVRERKDMKVRELDN